MDTRTETQRRQIMQSVRQKDTGPELAVRRALFVRGYRYRLHAAKLPGTPDIIFPSKRKALFVHGCFWHGHLCAKGKPPKSRKDYWGAKLQGNIDRDKRTMEKLGELGWQALVVWQCELKEMSSVIERIETFLEDQLDA